MASAYERNWNHRTTPTVKERTKLKAAKDWITLITLGPMMLSMQSTSLVTVPSFPCNLLLRIAARLRRVSRTVVDSTIALCEAAFLGCRRWLDQPWMSCKSGRTEEALDSGLMTTICSGKFWRSAELQVGQHNVQKYTCRDLINFLNVDFRLLRLVGSYWCRLWILGFIKNLKCCYCLTIRPDHHYRILGWEQDGGSQILELQRDN